MRLVVPYVDLHPETYRATKDYPEVEYVYVGGDDYEYARLLRELWADAQTFALVEHDVVPGKDTLARFALCDHWYCACPYAWTTHVGVTLGCTKFGREGLLAYPDAMEIAARIPCPVAKDNQGGHFRQIGSWLQAAVLAQFYGEQPHCHLPPVTHLNESQRLLDIHRDKPILTRVSERSYLAPGTVERIAADLIAGSDGT